MSVSGDMDPSIRQAPGPEAERWLMRLQSADCSEAERARFDAWHRADPANASAFAVARHYWQRSAQLGRDPELVAYADAVLARQKRRRDARVRWSERMPALAAAAVIAVVAVGVVAYAYRSGWLAPVPQVYATAIGERRDVTLEDGSLLTLNTDTAVEVRYLRNVRRLALARGEAQFDVRPDAQRPFTVTADGLDVAALGTRFQVRAGEEATVVTLLEGRVRVTGLEDSAVGKERNGHSVELEAGERLLMNKHGGDWRRSGFDPAAAAGWTEGRLVFRALPLPQVVAELNRYTVDQLRLADDALDEIRVNGVFDAGNTAGILAALQHAYPIQAEHISPGETILSRRQ